MYTTAPCTHLECGNIIILNYHPYLVFLLYADLLSLQLVTFLMRSTWTPHIKIQIHHRYSLTAW